MSRKGDCWDNVPMESFFALLKKELINHEHYTSQSEVRQSLFEYIEAFYKTVRKRSALEYRCPKQFQQST